MSVRTQRFADSDFKATPRSFNQPNPCASKPIPDFKTVRALLKEELDESSFYESAWKAAKKEFKQKKKSSPQYFMDSTEDECYVAVIAYTLEFPAFYRDFNKRFRQLTSASWEAFPYKSFHYLLMLSKDGVVNKPEIERTLYRGMTIHFPSEPSVGDCFYFDYFASCTSDLSTAKSYAGSKGTVIELKSGATEAIGIKYYSMYPAENEVLVFPNNKFKVVKFEKNYSQHRLLLERDGVCDDSWCTLS